MCSVRTAHCAVCQLRERSLVQAAHIIEDPDPDGIAAVVNGIALCAMHHLAYDRNLMGIDPSGIVHIGKRLRDTADGPMLREGYLASTPLIFSPRGGRRTTPIPADLHAVSKPLRKRTLLRPRPPTSTIEGEPP